MYDCKHLRGLAIIAATAVGLVGCSSPQVADNNAASSPRSSLGWKRMHLLSEGITFEIPTDWRREKDEPDYLAIFDGRRNLKAFTIAKKAESEKPTDKAARVYLEERLAGWEQTADVLKKSAILPVSINGLAGYTAAFSYKSEDVPKGLVASLSITVLIGNSGLFVLSTSMMSPALRSDAEELSRIVESFRVNPIVP